MNTIVQRITSARISITRAALHWSRPPLARTLIGLVRAPADADARHEA
ncbi:hypothetical protein OHA72_49410 [Dactylosporangium sp. NBC_01737]|nr:hypothetical protein OHA72_49410 [Dactylosporangium sp. NBC_01737]